MTAHHHRRFEKNDLDVVVTKAPTGNGIEVCGDFAGHRFIAVISTQAKKGPEGGTEAASIERLWVTRLADSKVVCEVRGGDPVPRCDVRSEAVVRFIARGITRNAALIEKALQESQAAKQDAEARYWGNALGRFGGLHSDRKIWLSKRLDRPCEQRPVLNPFLPPLLRK